MTTHQLQLSAKLGLAVLIALSAATFTCAMVYHYHPALGVPWRWGVLRVYPPWAIVTWLWQFGWQPVRLGVGVGVVVLGVGLVGIRRTTHRPQTPPVTQLGTLRDLRRLGLLEQAGVVLGRFQGRLVRYNGPEHVLCVGPTQSGKSSSHVITTLLEDAENSYLIHDPEGELYQKTAAWRSRYSHVIHLCPTDPQTHRYNPLDHIDWHGPNETRDLDLVTTVLSDPDHERQHGGAGEFYGELANEVKRGLIVYAYQMGATTLTDVDDLLHSQTPLKVRMKEFARHPHQAVRRAAAIVRDSGPKYLPGILTTLHGSLRIFADQRVQHLTAASDFHLADLRERPLPISLYLSFAFAEQHRLRPILRLIMEQVLHYVLDPTKTTWPHRFHCLTDEIGAFRYFPFYEEALSYAAKHGVLLDTIVPGTKILDKYYGPHHNFWEGSGVKLLFAPNSAEMAQLISRQTGETPRDKQRRAVTRVPGQLLAQQTTLSHEQAQEPLLSPTQVHQLRRDAVLLVIDRYTFELEQTPWYNTKPWKGRVHA